MRYWGLYPFLVVQKQPALQGSGGSVNPTMRTLDGADIVPVNICKDATTPGGSGCGFRSGATIPGGSGCGFRVMRPMNSDEVRAVNVKQGSGGSTAKDTLAGGGSAVPRIGSVNCCVIRTLPRTPSKMSAVTCPPPADAAQRSSVSPSAAKTGAVSLTTLPAPAPLCATALTGNAAATRADGQQKQTSFHTAFSLGEQNAEHFRIQTPWSELLLLQERGVADCDLHRRCDPAPW